MRHEEHQRDQDRRWDRESRYGERGRTRNDDWQRRHGQQSETSPWDGDEGDNESQRFGENGDYDDEGGAGRRFQSQGRGSQGSQSGRGGYSGSSGSGRSRFGRREHRFGQESGGYGENNPQFGHQGYDYGQSMYPENDEFTYGQRGGQYGQRGGDNYGQGGQYGQSGQGGQYGQRGDSYGQGGQYGRSGQSGQFGQGEYGQGRQGGTEYGGNRVTSNYRWMGNNWERTGNDRQMGQHGGKGPKGYKRSDDRIREDICDRFTDDHELDASNIEVKVQNCEVTLSGTVDDRQLKRLAEDIAEECQGVREVRNEIRVQQNGSQQAFGQSGRNDGGSQSTEDESRKRQSK